MPPKLDANTLYPVEEKTVSVDGFVLHPARNNESVQVVSRAFLNSYNPHDHEIISNIIRLFTADTSKLNNLLAIIRNDSAKIYRKFPLTLEIKAKEDIKAFTAVFQNQVLDICGVSFKDIIFEPDIRNGDKFLWLFRVGWSFGLYFDFTGQLEAKELSPELGRCFRTLQYYSLYARLDEDSFKTLVDRGWFPFIQLLPKEFEALAQCSGDQSHIQIVEDGLLKKYDRKTIEKFSNKWWRLELFREKKQIIEAGINAYLSGDQTGTINSIKNLFSEIEGILRMDFLKKNGRNPTFAELKSYVRTQGEAKFSQAGSLGFPGLFFDYLERVGRAPWASECGELRSVP